MADGFQPEPQASAADSGKLRWQSRYNGLSVVALLDGKAIAGISGPWSDKFALTWWDRPQAQRRLELFDSMQEAQSAVENWARRMGAGFPALSMPRLPARPQAVAAQGTRSLLDHLRRLVPLSPPANTAPRRTTVRSRESRAYADLDLDGLHFVAER